MTRRIISSPIIHRSRSCASIDPRTTAARRHFIHGPIRGMHEPTWLERLLGRARP